MSKGEEERGVRDGARGQRFTYSFRFGRRHYEVAYRKAYDPETGWRLEYGASLFRATDAAALRLEMRAETLKGVKQTAHVRFTQFPQTVYVRADNGGSKEGGGAVITRGEWTAMAHDRVFWRQCFVRNGMRQRDSGCFVAAGGARGVDRPRGGAWCTLPTLSTLARNRYRGIVCECRVFETETTRFYVVYRVSDAGDFAWGASVAQKSEVAGEDPRTIDARQWKLARRELEQRPHMCAVAPAVGNAMDTILSTLLSV